MTEPSAEKPQQRRTNYRQLFSFALCCGMICWIIEYPIQPVFAAANQNTLLVGEQALAKDLYTIPIAAASPFSGMTVEEILRLRVKSVWQQPLLIGINYRPSEAVFCRLRSRAAWRELGGDSQWTGPDQQAPSAGSEYVLNPYLLVAAEFAPVDVDRGLNDSAGPQLPATLTWDSRQRRAQSVYDVSGYLQHGNGLLTEPLSFREISLRLVALNARDMNLNYAAAVPEDARGILLPPGLTAPVLIEQYLRHDPDCGATGGCNEVSPPQMELTGLRLTDLPARITIRLWKDRPDSSTERPDMWFTLEFR